MEKKINNIAPVILAGGKSSRMGKNKAFAEIGGEPILAIVIKKLKSCFQEQPLLVTNTPEIYADFALPTTTDIFPGMGPLGGIHAALYQASKPYIFVVGCDMPFLSADLFDHMAKMAGGPYDVIAPCSGGRSEPLHAIYSANCLPVIEDCLKRGEKKIRSFFLQVRVLYLGEREIEAFSPDGAAFMNVNTPEDLLLAQKKWHGSQEKE